MPIHIPRPTRIEAAGNKPKLIEEYVGRVNSGTDAVSIARMTSPSGWTEPAQTPEFDEYTLVLKGSLRVTSRGGALDVNAGEAVIAPAGEWVQYSTPGPDGAEYIAVCLPAFSPDTVNREGWGDEGGVRVREANGSGGSPAPPRTHPRTPSPPR